MKRGMRLTALIFGLSLLCCCGELPKQGPLGTVETATQAVLQDETIYFLYPTGPVDDPTGIAKYALASEELTQLPGMPKTDVLGLQTSEDNLYYLTANSLYRCGLDGSAQALLADTSENGAFRNTWFFLLDGSFYLCRTSEREDTTTQVVTVHADGQVQLVWETDSYYPSFASEVCYWDGMLYYKDLKADEIRSVDLSDGSTEPVSKWVHYMFATSEGIVFGDESLNYFADGTSFCEESSGWFIGCDSTSSYFLDSEYSIHGTIRVVRDGDAEVLLQDFRWDMIAAQYIPAYQAGPYTLFYCPKDLIGDMGDEPDLVHYLYLLDGTKVKRIGYYTQDFLYS